MNGHTTIAVAAHELQVKRVQLINLLAAHCPAPHLFVQHRDRKPPWCEACRYTPDGTYIDREPT